MPLSGGFWISLIGTLVLSVIGRVYLRPETVFLLCLCVAFGCFSVLMIGRALTDRKNGKSI